AGAGGKPPEQTKAVAFSLPCRVGLVAQVGVLGLRVDRVLRHCGAGGAEGLLPDLLGQVIEAIAHAARPACHERARFPTSGAPGEIPFDGDASQSAKVARLARDLEHGAVESHRRSSGWRS